MKVKVKVFDIFDEKNFFHSNMKLRNYRHYVSHCPVSTLDWLPNFHHKVWLEGSFTCKVNRCVWGSNRDRFCSNRSPYHYTTAPNFVWCSEVLVWTSLLSNYLQYWFYLFNWVDIRDFVNARTFFVKLVDIVANETNEIIGYFFAWSLKSLWTNYKCLFVSEVLW